MPMQILKFIIHLESNMVHMSPSAYSSSISLLLNSSMRKLRKNKEDGWASFIKVQVLKIQFIFFFVCFALG